MFSNVARSISLTPVALMVSVFAEVLQRWSTNPHLPINMTVFNRMPLHKDVGSLIGDFTLPFLWNAEQKVLFVERAKAIQRQLWDDLEHQLFSGVAFQRESMTRSKRSSNAGAMFPVVLTSNLILIVLSMLRRMMRTIMMILERSLKQDEEEWKQYMRFLKPRKSVWIVRLHRFKLWRK